MEQGLLDVAGAARFLLDSCMVDGPMVDPFELAEAWGYRVETGSRSQLQEGVIAIRCGASNRMRFDCAHELGHIVAHHMGMNPRCERTANGIAAATLMPDSAWKRDVRAASWDLEPIVEAYGVSWQAAALRMVHTMSCVVSVWDQGRVSWRWRSPWLSSRAFSSRMVPDWERDLATQTVEHHCHLEECGGMVRAYWVPSPGRHRVVVVSQVEAWETMTSSPHPPFRQHREPK